MPATDDLELLVLLAELSPTEAPIDRRDLIDALGEFDIPPEDASMTLLRLERDGLAETRFSAIDPETEYRDATDERTEVVLTALGRDLVESNLCEGRQIRVARTRKSA